MHPQALFYYAREPEQQSQGKSRLGAVIEDQEAANTLAQALIEDMRAEYAPKTDEYQFYSPKDFPDVDLEDVGVGMNTIFKQLLKKHERVIIVGSDVPVISREYILHTFELLKDKPLVISPTIDKGYGLIGMNRYIDIFSSIGNFKSRTPGYNLVEETELLAQEHGVHLFKQEVVFDIDYPFDVARALRYIQTHKQEKRFTRVLQTVQQFPQVYRNALSIIVPVYNESHIILETLSQIDTMHYSQAIDWIFVDGGSADDTKKIIQNYIETHPQYQIRLLQSSGGRGGAFARGTKQAYGEIFVFLHADTKIPRNLPQIIRKQLTDTEIIGGAFTLSFDRYSFQYLGIALYGKIRSLVFNIYHGDQTMFIRRSVLEQLGGFPNIPLMEDVVLSKKMKKAGKTIYLPQKVISSSRRILEVGFFTSVFLYFFMKMLFFLGASPQLLTKIYRRRNK